MTEIIIRRDFCDKCNELLMFEFEAKKKCCKSAFVNKTKVIKTTLKRPHVEESRDHCHDGHHADWDCS